MGGYEKNVDFHSNGHTIARHRPYDHAFGRGHCVDGDRNFCDRPFLFGVSLPEQPLSIQGLFRPGKG